MIVLDSFYNRKQEIVHGIIHAVGILFGLSALPVLTGIAATHGNTRGIVGAGIYSFCFILLFTCSTVYHLAQDQQVKKLFVVLDHISIYFLIAGTYTPFLLVFMNNAFGITLLCILWGLTAVGVIFKSFFTGRFNILSTIIYLIMGWIMIVGGKTFFTSLPVPVITMIAIGGVLYSIGVYFYLREKRTYTHAVWHFFVLAAAICHYVAVLLSV
ncbi:MAG: hemolysin family protein [Bacteroidetes bacterium]|uniref:PAQR family membrane homeostasis protein TrhA n=1 Tax=unclassified Chitinophaga TaxID=2619133 RepID=UPI0009CD6990|nr:MULTISPECIES: hemolysin III family protein [unclassified Chitinophaga]MBP1651193.1 hemolysin family protein [Bacteroidota bacterium]OMP78994.1 hemolysin D [[Flexibacter] sp. ATCC 35208]WPV70239.1 hemolysin III family protein [Chitinophaga sp. LS1]